MSGVKGGKNYEEELKKVYLLLDIAVLISLFQGREVFAEAKYDYIDRFSEGLAEAEKVYKFGYIQ